MALGKSTGLVGGRRARKAKEVKRSSLQMGDLYKLPKGSGRTYMHTGMRTVPPSGNKVTVTVDGDSHDIVTQKVWKWLDNGRGVIGFQSIIIDGTVSPGEDGAIVTFDANKKVLLVGSATIEPELF